MAKQINENAMIKKISFVGIVGNVMLTAFKLLAGISGKSSAMISDAVHSLSDVFAIGIAFWGVRFSKRLADKQHPYGHERMECVASLILGMILLATGVGIGGSMMGFPVLDPAASVLISLFILKVGVDILKDALMKMMDTSCGEDYEIRLREYINSQEGVENIDVLRSRMFGNKAYVDLEIAVDAEKSLWESHAIAERIHAGVESKFPEVKHIMIHVNPVK